MRWNGPVFAGAYLAVFIGLLLLGLDLADAMIGVVAVVTISLLTCLFFAFTDFDQDRDAV